MEFDEIETGDDLAFSKLGPLAMKLQGLMRKINGHNEIMSTMKQCQHKELIKIK